MVVREVMGVKVAMAVMVEMPHLAGTGAKVVTVAPARRKQIPRATAGVAGTVDTVGEQVEAVGTEVMGHSTGTVVRVGAADTAVRVRVNPDCRGMVVMAETEAREVRAATPVATAARAVAAATVAMAM